MKSSTRSWSIDLRTHGFSSGLWSKTNQVLATTWPWRPWPTRAASFEPKARDSWPQCQYGVHRGVKLGSIQVPPPVVALGGRTGGCTESARNATASPPSGGASEGVSSLESPSGVCAGWGSPTMRVSSSRETSLQPKARGLTTTFSPGAAPVAIRTPVARPCYHGRALPPGFALSGGGQHRWRSALRLPAHVTMGEPAVGSHINLAISSVWGWRSDPLQSS